MTGNVMVDRTALGEPRNVVLDEKSDLTAFELEWARAGNISRQRTLDAAESSWQTDTQLPDA